MSNKNIFFEESAFYYEQKYFNNVVNFPGFVSGYRTLYGNISVNILLENQRVIDILS